MFCPQCGENNPDVAKFCLNCGEDLIKAKANIQAGSSQAAEQEKQEVYIFCPECGARNPDSAVSCEQCGENLDIAKKALADREKTGQAGAPQTTVQPPQPQVSSQSAAPQTTVQPPQPQVSSQSAAPQNAPQNTAPNYQQSVPQYTGDPYAAPAYPNYAYQQPYQPVKKNSPLKYILISAGILVGIAAIIIGTVAIVKSQSDPVPTKDRDDDDDRDRSSYHQQYDDDDEYEEYDSGYQGNSNNGYQDNGNNGYQDSGNNGYQDNGNNGYQDYDDYGGYESQAQPVQEEYYTSEKTGVSFLVPPEGYAQISFDGNNNTVPATFDSHTPTDYNNYDTTLGVWLDGGIGNSSDQNILFDKTTVVGGWSEGKTFNLSDLSSKNNYICVGGIYRVYLSYVGSYSEYVFSHHNQSYFDDAMLKVVELGDSGNALKFYFYVKLHKDSSEHVIEGIANVRRDARDNSGSSSSSGGSAGGSVGGAAGSTNLPTPNLHGSEKCAVCHGTAVCSICDGTGKDWGINQTKVNCGSCFGTGKCRYCKNGYVSY